MDTITGISTPIGKGAISIVRLSGDEALRIALRFFSAAGFNGEKSIEPNKMYLGAFVYQEISDKCLFVYFKAPHSYTGEDLVEFHLHGGTKLTMSVVNALLFGGARRALPGEFSKRAYLNGKMSLAEAEGVLGLINAESEAELNAGYRLLTGELGKKLRLITDKLYDTVTELTASLDYPDEMEDEVIACREKVQGIKDEIDKLYATAKTGRLVKNGINVAILGRPNAGKSSLLNALLGYDRAIVTEIAGTTRDTVSESLEYEGIKINLLDTAGIRESSDKIESIGIDRAFKAGYSADIVLYVIDVTAGNFEEDELALEKFKDKTVVKVYNKTDLAPNTSQGIGVSALTGEGVDAVLDAVCDLAGDRRLYGDMLTEERHIDAVRRAKEKIDDALATLNDATDDCLLIDLTACYQALREIDGGTATEEIIDGVFSRFCVGK